MSALATKRTPGDLFARVSEQVAADVEQLLALGDDVRGEMTRGDDDPQFVVVRVEEGRNRQSNANARIWPGHILEKVAEQINERGCVPGYKGHIPDELFGTVFPTTQTRWIKAATRKENGKTVLYIKGYNLPGREIRDEVRQKLATTVSWVGNAALKAVKGAYEVADFAIESLDWSRPGAEGMSAALVTVASEMRGGNVVEATEIAQLRESDIEQNCPSLVRVFEMRGEKKADEKINELQTKVTAAEEDQSVLSKVLELLGLDSKDKLIDHVTTLKTAVSNVTKERIEQAKAAALEALVPDEDQRAVISKFAVVSEMVVDGNTHEERVELAKTRIKEMIDTDDTIRKVVGEMQSGEQPLNLGGKGNETKDADQRYKEGSSTGSVRTSRVRL